MLALISPAKTLDFETAHKTKTYTEPDFQGQSQELINILKKMSAKKIKCMMGISDALVELNRERYQSYETPFNLKNAKHAIYAFKGDTYIGLDADSLVKKDLTYAQKHLRVVSGLYGLLRPLDLIQPYRLEMGTKLKTKQGTNLYHYWADQLANAANEICISHKNPTIVNLASNEYIKAVPKKHLTAPLLTCHFKEDKAGKVKAIGVFAKQARGMMARYMIQNRIESPAGLKKFNAGGYQFQASLSDDSNYVFTRKSN